MIPGPGCLQKCRDNGRSENQSRIRMAPLDFLSPNRKMGGAHRWDGAQRGSDAPWDLHG